MVFNCPKTATQYHNQYKIAVLWWFGAGKHQLKLGQTNKRLERLYILVNKYK